MGEVRGLVLLGVWRGAVRPTVLLGEPWKTQREAGLRSGSLVLMGPQARGGLTTLLLELFRWLWSSLVAPSWKVLGSAPSSMVNSGVLSSNRAIRTTWAACRHNNRDGSDGDDSGSNV